MRKTVSLMIGALAMLPNIALSLDTNVGRSKAANLRCIGCHMRSTDNPHIPNIKGQYKKYIAKQLRAFKSGKRKDSTMNGMAHKLSEEDIDALSTFFSTLEKQP